MEKWKVVESKILAKNSRVALKHDHVITENGTELRNYYWLDGPKTAMVVGVTDEGKMVFIEQFRYGINEIMLEFPQGMVNNEEDIIEAAKREFKEETGFEVDELYLEKVLYPSAGYTNIKVYICFARGLKAGEQELEYAENINIRLIGMDEILELIENNEIKNSNAVAAIFLALQKKDWFLG